MNILFLSRYYYPHIGGVEKHVKELSSSLGLSTSEYKITVLTEKYSDTLKDQEKIDGVEVIRFKYPNVKYLGLIYIWFWMINHRKLFINSDIIHIHDIFIWYLPLKLLLPRKRVFTTFHGWEGKYPIPLKNIILKKFASRLSNGSISVGAYIRKYYGIKTDFITYGAVDIPESNISTKDTKEILYVGRLEKDTGLADMLIVFEKLRNDYDINFCGDGILRRECEKVGKVHGFVNPEKYYKKAMYVFASGYLTILEAFANRCLVFAIYDNSLKKDYFLDTPFKDFIVSEENDKKLYGKFEYIQLNPKEAQNMINKGYNWVKGQSWENLTNLYKNLWEVS